MQWKSFFLFCVYFQFQPVPATIECVCLFAQFLSRTFKAVTSIQNYISGVRTLHALLEAPFHSADNIELKLTLRGLKRSKPHAVQQAAPLSPHIICKVHSLLDLTTPFDATLWALLLVAFFTLSRKSNLVGTGKKAFDRRRQLCRSDVLIGEKGLLVQFRWSKTNQLVVGCCWYWSWLSQAQSCAHWRHTLTCYRWLQLKQTVRHLFCPSTETWFRFPIRFCKSLLRNVWLSLGWIQACLVPIVCGGQERPGHSGPRFQGNW